jgi:hypothetical protein
MSAPGNSGRDPFFEKGPAKGKPPYDLAAKFQNVCPAPVSSFAVISFIFALVSPVVLCVCGFSVVTSFIAIFSGHVALARIKNSMGNLAGRGLAMFGVIVGYLMFGISVAFLGFFLVVFQDKSGHSQTVILIEDSATMTNASWQLDNAETHVLADTAGMATGNSDAALTLARDYFNVMKKMRDVMTTQSDDRYSALTESNFVTYCELHGDRCAFIVHVPDYGNFDDEAKDRLATIAWSVAQGTVEGTLQPGDELAVGLRGTDVYGAVLIGTVTPADEEYGEEADFEQHERDALLPFFLPTLPDPGRTSIPLQTSDESFDAAASDVRDPS